MTCHRHIGSKHYAEYQKRCKEGDIREKEAAMPKVLLAAMKRERGRAEKDNKVQTTLDGIVRKVEAPTAGHPQHGHCTCGMRGPGERIVYSVPSGR